MYRLSEPLPAPPLLLPLARPVQTRIPYDAPIPARRPGDRRVVHDGHSAATRLVGPRRTDGEC